jgi:uncharacterized repeat protein (TIGR01451 family)
MGRGARGLGLGLLAAGVCLLAGCFGITQNPSYFPHLLPTGDIIRTHAKPPGPGYFANFDPHAVRLEVRPLEATGPVRTQHVLIATVYDEKGEPRRKRRVEWMLEGAGNIVEVDESGFFPGRGYKVDNRYAVSYTDYHEHIITRGNADPNDDFVIRPGQSWCVITSAAEGDTYVTAYAPEIANWDAHKVFVTRHWIDAQWVLPPPAVNRVGSEHLLTTQILRHTDRQPLANYRVRYRILDGPPALFLPGRGPEAVAISDLSGNASAPLVQLTPQPGVNRISVEIIRPPDPRAPSGAGIVIGRGETTKEWQAGTGTLALVGPPTATVGQDIAYTITVTNTGPIDLQAMTVRDTLPAGVQIVRSDPPGIPEGNQLVWTLGVLPSGRSHTLQLIVRATRWGPLTNCAVVQSVEGLRDEKCVTTQVTEPVPGAAPAAPQPPPPELATPPLRPDARAPQLRLDVSDVGRAAAGVPFTYQITLTNAGTAPASGVMLSAAFDPGLEHETRANPLELPLGRLGVGETRAVPLTLTPRQPGRLVTRLTATADGNLRVQAERTVSIQSTRLAIAKTGPAARYVEQPITWDITIVNAGDTALNNVVIRDQLPPEVTFQSATQLGQVVGGQVVWNLGALGPSEQRAVQVTARCMRAAAAVRNVAVATADPSLQEQAEAVLEIRGVPAYRLDVATVGDPAPVGGRVVYRIGVTNTGSLPANGVEIAAVVPAQLEVLGTDGPTRARREGNRVLFPPADNLGPQQTFNYTVEARALQPGDVRFRVELRSGGLGQPVTKEVSTNVYNPANGSAPAPAAPLPR